MNFVAEWTGAVKSLGPMGSLVLVLAVLLGFDIL